MNEEQLGPIVSSWLKDEHRPPPDPAASVRAAMTVAPNTRQLGRRMWRPPFLHRMPDAPSRPHAADPTVPYQQHPISATNGHKPTVIGRTQSMLSPVKAITAGAVVFAIGGAFLIGQQLDQQRGAPGAATDSELMHPAPVSGSFTAFGGSGPLRVTVDASDPRLQVTGVYRGAESVQGSDDSESELSGVEFGTWELENDEGGWIGTGAEIDLSDIDLGGDATVLELDGLGGYDGLTASLLMAWHSDGFSFVGAIVPSELFPAPQATATQ